MRFASVFVSAGLLLLTGCAPALREAAPLPESRGLPPSEVDALLARAGELFESRSLEDVRRAAEVWLDAAAADPERIEGLVGSSRAGVWLAEHESDAPLRLRAAEEALRAAQLCGQIAPERPVCSYWLGAAVGLKARERPATGLSALPVIESAFRRAAEEAPELEEAGPDRALALLYLRAPGWPAGPGDPDRGLEHARRAVSISPAHPPNHLALAEALAATGDPESSRSAYLKALEMARTRLASGSPDASEWVRQAVRGLEGIGSD
jgi:tetratricopeptide (TPR) repeat protein